jgi:polysaccharide deacetylase 2 family uncharacterized protein YibQ
MPPHKKRKINTTKKRTTTRKRASKKASPRKRGRTSTKAKDRILRDVVIALMLLLLVGFGGVVYYLMDRDSEPSHKTKPTKTEIKSPKIQKPQTKDQPKPTRKKLIIETIDISDLPQKEPIKATPKSKPVKKLIKKPAINPSSRPKLVIIIDDVSTPKQLEQIKAISLKLTPSIFPPAKDSLQRVMMAKYLKHYMVHLPMEANDHPNGAIAGTLTTNSTRVQMRAKIKALRRWFPNAVYVNNHTGSAFTANYSLLHTLYGLLKKEGFVFVDSRTTHNTQGRRVASEYGDIYLYRDVFIDNTQKYGAIRKQLKLAIKEAKRKGFAIAIGHPYDITLQTLNGSLGLLADVDVVYMDELDRY